MGCLFGYVGERSENLLGKMAGRMARRCAAGWESTVLGLGANRVVAIGRGVPPWSAAGQVIGDEQRRVAFGHSGVFLDGQNGAAPSIQDLENNSDSALEKLTGCFTAAFFHDGRLQLVRDPAGVKALYWTRHRERLLFASEIKALFADPRVPRILRTGAIPEYLTFSFVPGQSTMFEDIFELQPGHILTFAKDAVSVRRHFLFENREWDGADPPADTPAFIRRVRADLEQSVSECCEAARVRGQFPAVFVSGGIDSSAVLATAAHLYPNERMKSFSVHFGSEYANENEYITMITRRWRTRHVWIEIRPRQFLDRLPQIVHCLDDPIGDPITVPNFLMAEAASKTRGFALNGEGGDPCYGGPKNIPMMLARLLGPLPGGSNGRRFLEREYLRSFRKCFADIGQLLDPAVLKESGGEEALLDVVTPFFRVEKPRKFINKLMATNIRFKGANLILVKVDKMTSNNGLLAMPPLFSRRVVEGSMACPPTLKLHGSIEKWALKQAVADLVPDPIIQRPKSGMMVPLHFWFQGEMRRYAKRTLSKRNLREVGLFNADYIGKILKYDREDVQGARHGLKLWMLITFMLWRESMLGSKTA